MKIRLYSAFIFVAAVVALGATVTAQEANQTMFVPTADAVKWMPGPPTLPKGTSIAMLNGDPAKPGPFVLRLKFRANSVVGPHRHATAENLTVITGDLYHETGDKLDKSRGDKVSAGGFVYLPGMVSHSVWTGGSESIVQVTGTGPFGVLYVDPADDSSKAHS